MKSSSMTWRSFENTLYEYDQIYLAGPVEPAKKIDRSTDMVRIDKQSYFIDNRPPNPIVTLLRNQPDVKKELVDSVLEKVRAN